MIFISRACTWFFMLNLKPRYTTLNTSILFKNVPIYHILFIICIYTPQHILQINNFLFICNYILYVIMFYIQTTIKLNKLTLYLCIFKYYIHFYHTLRCVPCKYYYMHTMKTKLIIALVTRII